MSAQAEPIVIVGYQKQYAEAFDRLNRAWLEQYDLLEEGDLKYLEHPEESILLAGGEIFFALRGNEVVGTCAVVRRDPATVELAKLAVAGAAQGRGIGQLLTERAIEWARAQGARKMILVSATRLKQALRLYERLGFRHGPLPADTAYVSADVYMELDLGLAP